MCIICQEEKNGGDLRDYKGSIKTLFKYSDLFNLKKLSSHLTAKKQQQALVKIHKKC